MEDSRPSLSHISDAPSQPLQKKRRAPKACCYFRMRKIRCNVVEHGPPCVNCRMDRIECNLTPTARTPQQFPPRVSKLENRINRKITTRVATKFPHSSNIDPQEKTNTPHDIHMPNYLEGLPTKLSPEDIKYLSVKGALNIPPPELRDNLLRSYSDNVHTNMPFIDISEFFHTVFKGNGVRRISLLLFQAVMFAGAISIDIRYLEDVGYQCRENALRDFFTRARLLYDFDCESERIHVVQALLLMTYWDGLSDDGKDSRYWLGISLSQSQVIGLNRGIRDFRLSDHLQKMCRRLWWCIYCRDRSLALHTGQPMLIKRDGFDVSPPLLNDFDFFFDQTVVSGMFPDVRNVQSIACQQDFVLNFIEKVELYIRVGDVF